MAEKTTFAGFSPHRCAPPAGLHLVAVVAFDGVVLGDLATACEVFGRVRGADGRALYDVRICGGRRQVHSEHTTLTTPWSLASLARAHTVIVPGIEPLDGPIPPAVLRSIRRAVARGARMASICTGAFVLAATGALDGLRATTHWRAAGELARQHPRVSVDADVLYVDNGSVLTSAGAAAGFDLCLHMVRRDFGAQVAADVARAIVMPLERAGGQAQFIVHAAPVEATSLSSLLTWIAQNVHRSLHLGTLARQAGMSTRTLSRRFREQVGVTPSLWVGRARVRHAQQLLETTDLSIERVAAVSGFGSAAVMREHFRNLVGTAPLTYRRAFRI